MLILFSVTNCSGKWSSYQGKMALENANKQCASLGMRLPTIEELRAAYAAREAKVWEKENVFYWSSTPSSSDGFVYLLSTGDGGFISSGRSNKEDTLCIR